MNLQYKINLTSLMILVTVTVALTWAGAVAITRLSYDLNSKLMNKEIANLQRTIQGAISVLEQSGVSTVEGYQNRAKSDVLANFGDFVFSKTGILIVVNKKDGKVLLNSPGNSADNDFLKSLALSDSGKMLHNYDNASRFFSYASNNDWDWLLVLSETTETILEVRRRFIEIALFIMIAVLGTGSVFLIWSTRKIVLPIKLLAKATDSISKGHWQTELPAIHGTDEIAQLTSSFQKMAGKLATTYTDLNDNIRNIKKSQEELSAEKERLAITLRSIGDGVISTDTNGHITLINKRAEELTGWSQDEAKGKHVGKVLQLIDPQTSHGEIDPVSPVIQPGEKKIFLEQVTLIAKDNNHSVISVSSAPIFGSKTVMLGSILVFRDRTEYLKMQEDLVRSHKLESVGILAGGIAHDFNNILSIIQGNIELATYRVEKDAKVVSLLSGAKKATKRAAKLTQQLLTFSKGGDPVKETTSLPKLITESADFVLHGSQVSCDYTFQKDLWRVNIDSGQIGQVIQNIILNAKHAMPKGGRINICCDNVEDAASESLLSMHEENYVRINVHDTGVGMPPEIIDKIFDPYFTTKQEGSGLGLAICHSIINKHDGHITVQSRSGKGTLFTIYLPAELSKDITVVKEQKARPAMKGARIMVMDDEEMIRNLLQTQLASLGHETVLVIDGKQLINKYQKLQDSGTPVDLVIMDLTIPGGMGGQEASQQLLQLDPEARIIVASGYSNDPVMANYREYGFCAAVAKPFDLEELKTGIDSALS